LLLVAAALLVAIPEMRKRSSGPPPVVEAVQAVKESVSPCRKATTWQPIDAIMIRWKDQVTLAGATPRLSLPDQIGKLQALRQESSALQMPACAAPAMQWLIRHQNNTIEGFLLFLRQSESESLEKSSEAVKDLEAYESERKRAEL
jgi:hypothetical protein